MMSCLTQGRINFRVWIGGWGKRRLSRAEEIPGSEPEEVGQGSAFRNWWISRLERASIPQECRWNARRGERIFGISSETLWRQGHSGGQGVGPGSGVLYESDEPNGVAPISRLLLECCRWLCGDLSIWVSRVESVRFFTKTDLPARSSLYGWMLGKRKMRFFCLLVLWPEGWEGSIQGVSFMGTAGAPEERSVHRAVWKDCCLGSFPESE